MVEDSLNEKFHHPFKIVLVGDVQVGKTSLIQRFIANQLPGLYIPTGFDKYSAEFEVGGLPFCTTIWDTSGSLTYDTVRPLVYQDTDIFLVCFNLGDWYSLHNVVNKWCPEIQKYNRHGVPIILVGLQNDQRFFENSYSFHCISTDEVKRKIVYSEEAMEASRQIGAITYIETCAYSPSTVREVFELAVLAANGNFNKTSKSFFGNKSLSFSTSLSLSSPTDSTCSSDGSSSSTFNSSSSKLKTSTSSTQLLTRHKSFFKLRKCKSKTDLKMDLEKKSCVIM